MMPSIEQPAFELRNVSLRRGGREILRDVSWSIPRGACAAILGPNGSGKSTLARILAGYMWPTSGEVFVNSAHFGEVDLNQLRRSVRLVQAAGPYDVDSELSAREVVLTGLFGTIGLFDSTTPQDSRRAEALLSRVGLSSVIESRYDTLSSGERIRALIARALMRDPALMLLDEPTAGLDLLAREKVLATVQSMVAAHSTGGPTIIMITHHVEELPPATSHVLLLDQGSIAAAGAPQEVLRADNLARVYQCPLSVRHENGRFSVHVDPSAWQELI
jgi:iron complex transport system ATP-binding protein